MKELSSLYLQSPKLNRLNILKEIAANSKVTQAELAKLCSLSVAMVNNYMKRLCRSGLLEYRRRSIKSVTYHLTPSGRLHIRTLQAQQISEMVTMFVAAKEQMKDRILSQVQGGLKRVVVFGSGSLAQLAFHALELSGANVIGVCSDDPAVIGSDFCGHEVMNPAQIRPLAPDVVLVADLRRTDEIFQNLESSGTELIRLDGFSEPDALGYLKPSPPLTAAADALNR